MAAKAVTSAEKTDSNTNKKMQIAVFGGTLTDNAYLALEVSSSDTVASLQARLESIGGIPPSRQRLILKAYAWPPAPYDHRNCSTSTAMATTEAVAGAEKTGSNSMDKKMQIFVVLPRPGNIMNPNTIALEVSSTDTVANLKARIEHIDGDDNDIDRRIPPERQRLVVAGSALPDDGVTTLAEVGVGDSSTVQLVETHMHVSVHDFRGRHIIYNLSSTDTVDTLKARYEAMEGVPADRQRLTLNPRWKELKSGRTLADYGVTDWSSVTLRRLRWDQTDAFMALGRVLAMKVRGEDTVGHVKCTVKAKAGVPVAAQRAYHTNKAYEHEDLEDGRTMEELGIMVRDGYSTYPPHLRIECRQQAQEGDAKEEEEEEAAAAAAAEGRLVPCRPFEGDLLTYYKSQAKMRLARLLKRRAARKEKLPYGRPSVRMAYRILHVFLEAPDPMLQP